MLFRLVVIIITLSFSVSGQAKQFEINGVSIQYTDFGKGTYTFVFESGVGMGLNYWESFIPVVSDLKSRIIMYSRAGNGASTQSDNITLNASTIRLNRLLESLKVTEKIILVGHSFGGFHARHFANAYPNKVAGLVLLDPSHELFQQKLEVIDRQKAISDNARINSMLENQPEWKILQKLYTQKTLFSSQPTNNIPTVIVTSSQLNESEWWIGHSKRGKDIWRSLHHQLISDNPTAAHIITNKVGHNLPIQDPGFTLKAIKVILELVENT